MYDKYRSYICLYMQNETGEINELFFLTYGMGHAFMQNDYHLGVGVVI
jgi:hypothetical protein